MQIVVQTWLDLVTWTCGSWSEGQHGIYFTVHWFCLISWRLFDVCTSYFEIMNRYDSTFYLKINVGHFDLYFMVQRFCLISWRLFDVWTSFFCDYESVWPSVWPQNKCRSLWLTFHGPVILRYILNTVWYMNIILWDYGSVWPDVWPKNKCSSMWPVFHGPVIFFLYLLFDAWVSYFQIMRQCEPNFDLKVNMSTWPTDQPKKKALFSRSLRNTPYAK